MLLDTFKIDQLLIRLILYGFVVNNACKSYVLSILVLERLKNKKKEEHLLWLLIGCFLIPHSSLVELKRT